MTPVANAIIIHPSHPIGEHPGRGGAERFIAGQLGLLRAARVGVVLVGRQPPDFHSTNPGDVNSAGAVKGKDGMFSGVRVIETPAGDVDFTLELARPRPGENDARAEERASEILVDWYGRLFDDVRPAFVEVHNLQGPRVRLWGNAIARAARARDIPTIKVVHNSIDPGETSSFPEGYSKYVFVSYASRQRFIDAGVQQAREGLVIHGGTDRRLFRLGVKPDDRVSALHGSKIFGLGRASETKKGMRELLEAFAVMMEDKTIDASLVLCDAADELTSERGRIKLEGLKDLARGLTTINPRLEERIAFIPMPHSAVPGVIAASDIVAVPSTWYEKHFHS